MTGKEQNYSMIRWKIEHTIEKFEHRQKSLESGIDRKSVISLLCWKRQKTTAEKEYACLASKKLHAQRDGLFCFCFLLALYSVHETGLSSVDDVCELKR